MRHTLKATIPVVCGASDHDTPFGGATAFWSRDGLLRLEWPRKTKTPGIALSNGDFAGVQQRQAELDSALEAYFDGDFARLDNIAVDRSGWTPFFARVYRVCRNIPAGQTLSYGEVAANAGSPGAARAVGQAMATNRVPLIIPCHRVLASGGGLGGYSGPGGLSTKQSLLRLEGVI
jgi:methylated-DNA-[protein]-cysteine S-methyltransferase